MRYIALNLETGTNVYVALLPRAGAPIESTARIQMIAYQIGAILGAEVELAGKEPVSLANLYTYVIGGGRPVHIMEIGPSDRIREFSRVHGDPAGPEPYAFSVAIEWREGGQTRNAPAEFGIAIPLSKQPVTGSSEWPDGDLAKQSERLESAEMDSDLSATAATVRELQDVSVALASKASSALSGLLFTGALALGALWLLVREVKTR